MILLCITDDLVFYPAVKFVNYSEWHWHDAPKGTIVALTSYE